MIKTSEETAHHRPEVKRKETNYTLKVCGGQEKVRVAHLNICMNRRENRQCAEEHKEDIPQLWQALLEDIEVGHARLSAGILRDLQLRFLLFLEFMMAIEAVQRQRKIGVKADEQHEERCDKVINGGHSHIGRERVGEDANDGGECTAHV